MRGLCRHGLRCTRSIPAALSPRRSDRPCISLPLTFGLLHAPLFPSAACQEAPCQSAEELEHPASCPPGASVRTPSGCEKLHRPFVLPASCSCIRQQATIGTGARPRSCSPPASIPRPSQAARADTAFPTSPPRAVLPAKRAPLSWSPASYRCVGCQGWGISCSGRHAAKNVSQLHLRAASGGSFFNPRTISLEIDALPRRGPPRRRQFPQAVLEPKRWLRTSSRRAVLKTSQARRTVTAAPADAA